MEVVGIPLDIFLLGFLVLKQVAFSLIPWQYRCRETLFLKQTGYPDGFEPETFAFVSTQYTCSKKQSVRTEGPLVRPLLRSIIHSMIHLFS